MPAVVHHQNCFGFGRNLALDFVGVEYLLGGDAKEVYQVGDKDRSAGEMFQGGCPNPSRPGMGEAFDGFAGQGGLALTAATVDGDDAGTGIACYRSGRRNLNFPLANDTSSTVG